MAKFDTLTRPWRIMPLIQSVEGVRVPRGLSYSSERDAGRVLAALVHPQLSMRRNGRERRVFLRNVSVNSGAMGKRRNAWRIENSRELAMLSSRSFYTHSVTRLTRFSNIQHSYWHTLEARGWQMIAEPFLLVEPMPNCLLEMPEDMFRRLYAEHRYNVRGSIEALRTPVPMGEMTPMIELLRAHYDGLGVMKGWTPERVARLCRLWSITRHELAELILWPQGRMDDWMNGRGIELPGTVMLWFFFLETLGRHTLLGDPMVEIFPSMQLRKAT